MDLSVTFGTVKESNLGFERVIKTRTSFLSWGSRRSTIIWRYLGYVCFNQASKVYKTLSFVTTFLYFKWLQQ